MDQRVTPPVETPQPPAPARGGLGLFLTKVAGVLLLLVLAGLIVVWGVQRYVEDRLTPDPTTIARASLDGLREQNRLSAFAARYVAVVTSRQSQLGFSTERTLIMPGMVRYEVDLGKLRQQDVRWDANARVLSVTLPPVEIDGPQVDLSAIRSAIRDTRKVRVEYVDEQDRHTRRTIWPIALAYYVNATLIAAWCEMRTDYRHFRVDRIENMMVLEEHYPPDGGKLMAGWLALEKEWRRAP